MSGHTLQTERLELVCATPAMLHADLGKNYDELGEQLDAVVTGEWPPELLDEGPIRYTLEKLNHDPEHAGWWMWYIILAGDDDSRRTLIGTVGYKGPPDENGMIEVGYGILPEFLCKGYATEATKALIERAFAIDEVTRAIAETLPELAPSIRVMEKCGMQFVGEGSEDGVIRYEVTREAWHSLP